VSSELDGAHRAAADGSQPGALDGLDRRLGELDGTAYQLSLFR
jgi:hypothetical protein